MTQAVNITFLGLFLCSLCIANPVAQYTDAKECVKSGLMCETCTTSVMCVKINGKFTKTGRMNCGDGSTCFNGTCTKDVNPACDYVDLDFPCQYQGLYPHPGDWTKYIFCAPTTNEPTGPFTVQTIYCEPGTGYNPKTSYCNKNLTIIGAAEFPIERCLTQSVEPIALASNPAIYYICSPYGNNNKLYPYQSTCPSGGNFSNGECNVVLE